MTSQHELWWGSYLISAGAGGTELPSGCRVEVVDEGMTLGSPEPVLSVVRQLLDGSRVTKLGDDNRTASFDLELSAADSAELAAGGVEIDALIGVPSTLTWVPPDGFGSPTVFEVETSRAEFQFAGLDELRVKRTWKVTLTCAPFVRALERVTVPAVLTTTSITVDTCDSATGWTVEHGSVASSGGAVVQTRPRNTWSSMTRTGSVNMTDTPYLVVEWSASFSLYFTVAAHGGPNWAEVRRESVGGGWERSTFLANSPITSAGLRFGQVNGTDDPASGTFSVRSIARASTIGSGTTLRAKVSTIPPLGSVRSVASLHVSSPNASGLGDTLVLTHPVGRGFTPPMTQWFSAGARTADASTVSGYRHDISPLTFFVAPASLFDEGKSSLLLARMRCTMTTGNLAYGTESWMNLEAVGQSYGQADRAVDFAAADTWQWIPLDILPTPPTRLGPNGDVTFAMQRSVAQLDRTIEVDELLVLPITPDTSLTWVEAGDYKHVWIDEPVNGMPPAVWVGNNADRSDAWSADSLVVARDNEGHVAHPGGTSVFTVTTGVLDASTEMTGFERYRDHVA